MRSCEANFRQLIPLIEAMPMPRPIRPCSAMFHEAAALRAAYQEPRERNLGRLCAMPKLRHISHTARSLTDELIEGADVTENN